MWKRLFIAAIIENNLFCWHSTLYLQLNDKIDVVGILKSHGTIDCLLKQHLLWPRVVAVPLALFTDLKGGWSFRMAYNTYIGPLLISLKQLLFFEVLQSLLDFKPPGLLLSLPSVCVSVGGFQVTFTYFFVAWLWPPWWPLSWSRFSIEEVFGVPAIIHMIHMTKPAKVSLIEECGHGSDIRDRTSLFDNLSFQEMQSIWWRQHIWNAWGLLS